MGGFCFFRFYFNLVNKMMNWRNIYIQNPYTNECNSKERPQRYTPTRKQKTNNTSNQFTLQCLRDISHSRSNSKSQQKSTSAHKNLQLRSPIHNRNPQKLRTLKTQSQNTGKKYMVAEQWIINLKAELKKLLQCVHSLVFMNKNNMHRVDKFIKNQSMKIKEDFTRKMNQIINQMGLISKNSTAKLMEQNIRNVYVPVKTEASQQKILRKQEQISKTESKRPFTLPSAQAHDSAPTTLLMKPTILKQASILTQNQSQSQSPQYKTNKKQGKDYVNKGSLDKKVTADTTTPAIDAQVTPKYPVSPSQKNVTETPKSTLNKTTKNPESQVKNQKAIEPSLSKPAPSEKQRYTRSKTATYQTPATTSIPNKTQPNQPYNKVPQMKQTVKNINNCINNMAKMLQNMQ